MLSRTASNLYWLARHVERAENTARLVQITQRMAAIAPDSGVVGSEWRSAVVAAGGEESLDRKYDSPSAAQVIDFLVRDPDNPSSVMHSIESARTNARAVRNAISSDMWEAVNGTWLAAQDFTADDMRPENINDVLDWVKRRSSLFHGSYENTMLRRDGYFFTAIGTAIERADNTARILDVKYHVLLPSTESIGGGVDYYQWTTVLRSVSALRAYHVLYPSRVQPWNVSELLILRPEMPRSLVACLAGVVENLTNLAQLYDGGEGECHRLAGEMHAQLKFGRIEAIFGQGLHEFLTEFIDRNIELGHEIGRFYLM